MGIEEIEHPDWLPVGWKVIVKARSTGKKDKYYIDPSTGRKFSSRPQVLQYLKGSKKIRKAKNPIKVEIRKPVSGELPPGWIKKIRTTTNHGRTRRDPTYIDPVSGLRFRSMQEVFRYIESKPIKRGNVKQDATESRRRPQPSSAKAKEPSRLISRKADESLVVCKRAKSEPGLANGLKGAAMENENMTKGTCLDQKEEVCLAIEFSDKLQKVKQRADKLKGKIKKLANTEVIKYADKDQTPKSEKKVCVYGRRQSERLADIRHKDNLMKNHSILPDSKVSMEKNINKIEGSEGLNNRESSKRKWMGELPRRTSQRHARVGAGPSSDGKINDKTGSLDEPEIDIKKVKSNSLKELPTKGGICSSSEVSSEAKTNNKSGPLDAPDINIKKTLVISNGSKELHTKHRVENLVNNHQKPITLEEQKIAEETHVKHPEYTLANLLMDPCIEFAIKTLTGAIPIEDVTKVSNSSPPVNQASASSSMLPSTINVWTDPCFEFAVKTLTGEAPAQFQITIQQAGRAEGGKTQVR